jgi:hypothetical protein
MIKPFDATTFARNLDPAKITRKLTIAGKEIEIPEGAETNFSALNNGQFKLTLLKSEHSEIGLAPSAKVWMTERYYDSTGTLVAEMETQTPWSVSGVAASITALPLDYKVSGTRH